MSRFPTRALSRRALSLPTFGRNSLHSIKSQVFNLIRPNLSPLKPLLQTRASPRFFSKTPGRQLEREFIEWCHANEIFFPKLKIGYDSQGRRGLFAAQPIQTNDFLACVPRSLTLTARNFDTSIVSLTEGLSEASEENPLKAQIQLALLLAYESANPDSTYMPYFDMLPRPEEIRNAVYLTPAEIENALGVKDPRMVGFRELVHQHQEEIKRCLESDPVITAILEVISENYFNGDMEHTKKHFLWCLSLSYSRGFPLEDSLELIPLLDFINHPDEYMTPNANIVIGSHSRNQEEPDPQREPEEEPPADQLDTRAYRKRQADEALASVLREMGVSEEKSRSDFVLLTATSEIDTNDEIFCSYFENTTPDELQTLYSYGFVRHPE